MTTASHHHGLCPARQGTDDDCRCTWLTHPEWPAEKRHLLTQEQTAEAWRQLAEEYPDGDDEPDDVASPHWPQHEEHYRAGGARYGADQEAAK